MKSAGLNQNFRRMQKQVKKITAFSAQQASQMAAKERLKSLRMQAERMQLARQAKDAPKPEAK